MSVTRLIIRRDGRDVSDEIALTNGRSNPFGWSHYALEHEGIRIGWLESGYPEITDTRYTAETVEDASA